MAFFHSALGFPKCVHGHRTQAVQSVLSIYIQTSQSGSSQTNACFIHSLSQSGIFLTHKSASSEDYLITLSQVPSKLQGLFYLLINLARLSVLACRCSGLWDNETVSHWLRLTLVTTQFSWTLAPCTKPTKSQERQQCSPKLPFPHL